MKQIIKRWLGMLLTFLMPARARKIRQNVGELYWGGGRDLSRLEVLIERYMSIYIAHRDLKQQGGSDLEQHHREFWQKKMSTEWYEGTEKDFNSTVKKIVHSLTELDRFLEKTPIKTICEIGTGDGQLLAFLDQRYGGKYHMVGLDIAEEQMEKNNQKYSGYDFYGGDASAWIQQSSVDETLFLTNHGVFEYFSEQTLHGLLVYLQQHRPRSALMIISEPIAESHDLDKQENSILTTMGEYSFSHNHVYLLKQAGFTLVYQQENTDYGFRAMTIIATCGKV